MAELNINVRVQIGVTDALCGLLSTFAKGATREAVAIPPAPVPAPETKPAEEAAPVRPIAEVPTTQTTEAPSVEAAPVPAPAPESEKELTEVDVRAAMDRTRRRIEGEDYKTNVLGEGYQKWHSRLSRWFRNTSSVYGADKPSTLPDHESRKKFIADCEKVVVENDELIIKPPL